MKNNQQAKRSIKTNEKQPISEKYYKNQWKTLKKQYQDMQKLIYDQMQDVLKTNENQSKSYISFGFFSHGYSGKQGLLYTTMWSFETQTSSAFKQEMADISRYSLAAHLSTMAPLSGRTPP